MIFILELLASYFTTVSLLLSLYNTLKLQNTNKSSFVLSF